MTTRLVLFTLLLLGLGQTKGFAQTIYNYTNASDGSPSTWDPNLIPTNITLGTGTTPVVAATPPCGATQGFGAQGWPTTNVFNDVVFNAAGHFVEFTLTPANFNLGLKITGFSTRSRRENLTPGNPPDGPLAMRYAYSVNGPGGPWIATNPGNPGLSNLCTNGGTLRAWPAGTFPIVTSNPITFRIYGLSSGSDGTGDLYLRDVVVNGEVCDNEPDITLTDNSQQVCRGVTTAPLAYTGTNGSTYSIDYDAAANTAGFTDVGIPVNLNLPSVPNGTINLTVPALAAPGTYNGTLTVYNACGFSAIRPFTVEVWALPTAVLSGTQLICAGASATLTTSLTGGAPWTLTLNNGGGTFVTPNPVVVSPLVNTTYSITALTDGNGCVAVPAGLTGSAAISLHTAPTFNFSAASTSNLPESGNNTNGPSTISIDFCEGDFLMLSGYGDNGNIGHIISFTTSESSPGVSNVEYNGGPLPSTYGPDFTTILPSTAGTYFAGTYGDYGLSSGTSGTITQVYTPYLDVNGNDAYDLGIDCPGNPMTLIYNIHAIPDVDAVTDITVCKGETVSVDYTGAVPGTTYNWTNSNTAIGLAASGSGDILPFLAANNTAGDLVATIVVTPVSNGCTGSTETYTITVHPAPTFGFSAGSDSDPAQAGNNTGGPTTISVDFCAGDELTLSAYTDNGAIGFFGSYTTSGNTTANGVGLGAGPVAFSIAPSGAAGFFNGTYGGVPGYALSVGTYGWINQVFTPYIDVNGNDAFDDGIDCAGTPMTLVYNIYAPISLSITRTPAQICSGGTVNYTISTTSTEDVTFDLILEDNGGGGANPADLSVENGLPITITGLTVNDVTPYNYSKVINNALGAFDRGQVRVRAVNIGYADADVCTTANVNGQNTQVYPKPRLDEADDKIICNGNSTNLDIDLDPASLPSVTPANAGYDVGINWTVSAIVNVTGAVLGNSNLTIHTAGGGDVSSTDIAQALTLVNPLLPGSVTYTITPRSMGPGGGYNANDCNGDPITVVITVVPPAVPTITGANTVHMGSQIQLTGTHNVQLPATVMSEVWSVPVNPFITVDNTGLVTAVTMGGPTTVSYTVTDDAGCVSTATQIINVTPKLSLATSVVGSSLVACGSEVMIEVAATDFTDLASLNFNVNWDETKFELVTFDPLTIGGTNPTIDISWVANGDLNYFWFDGVIPFSATMPPSTVILKYTLRAIGSNGPSNLDITDVPIPPVEAFNSSYYSVPVLVSGASVEIVPMSISLDPNPVVCPTDDFANLTFSSYTGNPTHFFIDFLGCPLFPDTYEADFDPEDGVIVIPLLNGLQNGACDATLVVSNDDNGCVSLSIPFSIIIDQTDPYAVNPAPLNLVCIADIPDPNINVVEGEHDYECTDPEDLVVAFAYSTQSGTGCQSSPLVIERRYTVTDEAGNTTTVTQTITVLDEDGPTVETTGMDLCYGTVAEAEAAALALANASKKDNCSPPVAITVAINTPTTFVGCTATIHLSVTDACGNVTLANYTTVVDTEDPVITNPGPLDDCYTESDDPNSEHYPHQDAVDAAIAAVRLASSDNCTTDPNDLDITAVTSGPDCDLDIIVTVADECGRTTTWTYNTRVESDAPIITANTNEMEGDCYTTEAEAIAAAKIVTKAGVGDDCTSPNDLQFDIYVLGGCPAEILVVVSDYCGNQSSITYTGVHIDTEAPEVDPDAIYPICYKTLAAAYEALAVSANPIDNCTSETDLIESAVGSAVEVGDLLDNCKEYEITITFTDNCGNSFDYVPDFITIDNVAPTAQPLPALVYACLVELDDADPNIVVGSDNCGVFEVVHLGDNPPTSCPGTGTRTYRVYDCAGNYYDLNQNITINDDEPPSFTTVEEDLDRSCPCGDTECMTAALALVPAVQDNCGEPTFQLESDNYLGGCNGERVRVWRAYDDCGNASEGTFTQTITIVDEVAPTWLTGPYDLQGYVECSNINYLNFLLSLEPQAQDDCNTATVTQVEEEFVYYVECYYYLGYYKTTFVATDLCGNESAPYYQYVYLYDITPPAFTTAAGELNKTISCEDVAGLAFAQSLEPETDEYCTSATLVKIPGSFVPGDCPQEGSYTNLWYVYDECGNYNFYYEQVINIVDQNAPTWTTLPGELNSTLECGDNVGLAYIQALAPVATDLCDPSVSVVKTAGTLVTSNCSNTGTITNTWTATDDCGNVSGMYTQIINIVDYTPPTITVGTMGTCYPTVLAAETAAKAAISATDNCTLTGDIVKSATTYGDPCEATIVVNVTDCANNTTQWAFYNIRIDNSAPTMVVSNIDNPCFSSQALAEAAAVAATTITDDCDDIEDLDIDVVTAGVCPTMTITITATDACGNSRSVTYNGICIDNVPPVITTPASDLAVSCSPTLQAQFTAWLNNHGGAVATGNASWSTDPASPSLAGGCNGGTLVTFIASDNCGNMAPTAATFSYTDNTAPTASNLLPINVSCISAIPAPDPTLVTDEADNCDATPTVAHFADAVGSGTGCPGSPRIIGRTYSVTDDCGNTTYVTQTITAVDNVAPTFSAPPNITLTVDVNCNYDATVGTTGDVTNESDNCSGALNAVYTDVITPGVNTPVKSIITRTWQLVDACGNAAIPRTQIITVRDEIAPTLACPDNVTVTGGTVEIHPCAATFTNLQATGVNDNCDGEVLSYQLSGPYVGAGSGSGNVPNSIIFLEGLTTVTYTVKDAVGNQRTCSFTVGVNCVTISGRLIWEHDDVTGVGSGTVNLLDAGNFLIDSDLTPASGNYSLTPTAMGSYTIRPLKNVNRNNGLTTADVTRLQQHLQNNPPIVDPYKKVCADVTHNGTLNAQDISALQFAIANPNTPHPQFNIFWRFVPTTYVMPSPTALTVVPAFPEHIAVTVNSSDILGQDFYGMKLGDIAAGWANPASTPTAPLVWVLKDQTLVAGTEIELDFAASNFKDLASYQMALDFDPMQLQFVGFQPLGALPMNMLENFGSSNAVLGELRNLWADASGTTLSDGTPVFRAKFKVLKSGQKLSEVLKLDDSEIPCVAYSETLMETDMKLVFTESVGTDSPLDLGNLQLQLMQNRPNPFADATTIGFILPEACEAHIRILDISGRELTSYDRNYTAGYHELEFRMENAWSYGILFCELVTPQGKRTIKMMTAK